MSSLLYSQFIWSMPRSRGNEETDKFYTFYPPQYVLRCQPLEKRSPEWFILSVIKDEEDICEKKKILKIRNLTYTIINLLKLILIHFCLLSFLKNLMLTCSSILLNVIKSFYITAYLLSLSPFFSHLKIFRRNLKRNCYLAIWQIIIILIKNVFY